MKSALLLVGNVMEKMTVGIILMKMDVLPQPVVTINFSVQMDGASQCCGSVIEMMTALMDQMSLTVIKT